MNTVRHYFEVYKSFLSTCFAEAASFRLNFVLLILVDMAFYATALGTVDVIFRHVPHIGPWGREQFMFFTAFMMVVDHLHMTFISEGFWNFSDYVSKGLLDFILIKPLGAIFSVFFRFIRPASLSIIFVPWSIMIYYGIQAKLGVVSWFYLPVLVLLATALLVAIEILISLATFWLVEAVGINILRTQFQQVSRWPDFVYRYGARKFFTFVVPVLLVGSLPVQFIFNPLRWDYCLGLILALAIVIMLNRWFWERGLRHYESASS